MDGRISDVRIDPQRPPAPSEGVLKGRGTSENPANRFERLSYSWEDEGPCDPDGDERPSPRTLYMRDPSRQILSHNDSPDVPFDTSVNPYRGCEHGCVYCYARPTHEYLGFSAGLDFETRILVKERAPELLREALGKPSWKPQVIGMCGVTDAYQPIERRLRITRRCLEVLAEFRNPVGLITKNALVAQDVDVLSDLARWNAASVSLSITTLDGELQRVMEPRASHPQERLRAVERLSSAGIPVGVTIGPVIPGLTDHEIPAILDAAAKAGARRAGFIMLRLPHGVADLFETWLKQHRSERAAKVMSRIRSVRDGRLNDPGFGSRMRGGGIFAEHIEQLFDLSCRRVGLTRDHPELSTRHFRGRQLSLFG
jgi:DNA repair photolyase